MSAFAVYYGPHIIPAVTAYQTEHTFGLDVVDVVQGIRIDYTFGPYLIAWTGQWSDVLAFSLVSRASRRAWAWYCGLCGLLHTDHQRSTRLAFNSIGSADHLATAMSLCFRCQMAAHQRVSLESRQLGNFRWCIDCNRWCWDTFLFPHSRAAWAHRLAPLP